MKRKLSNLALKKLDTSGINEKQARRAGIYSVSNARKEVDPEFSPRAALIIPYFDINGETVCFERNSKKVPFVRVRYLDKQNLHSFTGKKLRRYAQLKGSGVHPYFPKICDWSKINQDTEQGILITEGELKALSACVRGYPTIGLGGVDCFMSKRQ